jgi:hypothetical protein
MTKAVLFKLVFFAIFGLMVFCLFSFIGLEIANAVFKIDVTAETLNRFWELVLFCFGFLTGGLVSAFAPKPR